VVGGAEEGLRTLAPLKGGGIAREILQERTTAHIDELGDLLSEGAGSSDASLAR